LNTEKTIHNLPNDIGLITNMNRKLSQVRLIVLIIGFCGINIAFARQNVTKFKLTVYLIGNTGNPKNAQHNFNLFKQQLSQEPKDASLIFLGDILYPNGMPSKNHPKRKIQEARLIPQLDLIKSFKGKSFIVIGDRDWYKGGTNGWDQVRFEEEFVENYLDDQDFFLPKSGYPGPVEVKLDKGVYLIYSISNGCYIDGTNLFKTIFWKLITNLMS
jgi:hypothetical protein